MQMQAQPITIVCGVNDQPTAIQHWLNQQGGAVAIDLCGGVTWTHNFPALSDTCGPVGTHTIRFTATDDCGNATFPRRLAVVDIGHLCWSLALN